MLFNRLLSVLLLGTSSTLVWPQTPENEVKIVDGLRTYTISMATLHHPDQENAGYWRPLRHLTSNGESIFAVGLSDPIYEIDTKGNAIGTIGGLGKGPGEYLQVFGMAAKGKQLWVLSENRIMAYRNGQFEGQKRLQTHDTLLFFARSDLGDNTFDIANGQVVLPFGETPKPGQIGSVYDLEGNFLKVVEDPGFDASLLKLSYLAQKTMWQHHDGIWHCAYMYLPRIAIYDSNFQFIGAVEFETPIIRDYLSDRLYNPKLEKKRKNIPLFHKFQVYEGEAYLAAEKALHRVDPTSGEMKSLIQFKPTGSDAYENTDNPTPRMYAMQFFHIFNDRRIVTGSLGMTGMLFVGKLPPFKSVRQTILEMDPVDQQD